MNNPSQKIILGIIFNKNSAWRSVLTAITPALDSQLGLFLQGIVLEERKEIYRLLEATPLKNIPYVQLATDSQEWEINFFVEKFATSVFSIPAVSSSLSVIDHWPVPSIACLLENVSPETADSIFTQDIMSRPGIKGVCLDSGALELKRLHQAKLYQVDIGVLDHQTVGCTIISPVPHSTLGRLLAKPNRLTSLTDLRYLKHFSPKFFSSMLVLKLYNTLEEQLEVKQYLASVYGGSV